LQVAPVELVVSSESSCAVRLARHSQNAWARHVERVESCRVESRRAKWNLGSTRYHNAKPYMHLCFFSVSRFVECRWRLFTGIMYRPTLSKMAFVDGVRTVFIWWWSLSTEATWCTAYSKKANSKNPLLCNVLRCRSLCIFVVFLKQIGYCVVVGQWLKRITPWWGVAGVDGIKIRQQN